MRKILFRLIAVLSVMALVAACGDDDSADSGNTTTTATDPANGDNGGGEPTELETIKFRMANAAPTPAMLPFFLADELGFYEEQGLEVEVVQLGAGSAFMPALSAGEIDALNSSTGAEAAALEGGLDLQVVNGHSTGFNYTILVREGVEMPFDGTFEEKMAALEGMTVGTQGGDQSLVYGFVKALMDIAEVDADTVEVANINYGGPMIAAFQSRSLDIVVADEPTQLVIEELGLGSLYFSLLDDPPAEYQDLVISGTAVSGSFLEQHPDFAERHAAAMDATYEYMRDEANVDEMLRVGLEIQGLTESEGLGEALSKLGSIYRAKNSREVLQASIDFLYMTDQLSSEPRIEVDDLFAPSSIE